MSTQQQRIEFKERIHRDKSLSRAEALIALRMFELSLGQHGCAYPSVEQLMEMEGIKDRRTVQRARATLVSDDHKYFTVKVGGDKRQRNEYRPVYLSHAEAVAKLEQYGLKQDTESKTTSRQSRPKRGSTIKPDRGPIIDSETFEEVVENMTENERFWNTAKGR
jgi:hypothetical protein